MANQTPPPVPKGTSICSTRNEFHLEDEELKSHIKATAFLHLLLHKAPVQAVGRFKDPGFCIVAEKHQHHPWVVLLKVLLATAVTVMLPTAYGFTIMDNPCTPHNLVMKDGGFADGVLQNNSLLSLNHWKFDQHESWEDLQQVGLAEDRCAAQDFMVSWKALLITPSMVLVLLTGYQLLHCVSRSLHARMECGLKKQMRPEVEALCYGGACDIPAVYNAVLLGYVGMAVAFGAVAALLEDVTALVMAFALSKLFLKLCTLLLGASQELKERYDAEICTWLPDGSDAVKRLFENPGPLVWLTQKELRAICCAQEDISAQGWLGLLECVQSDQIPISNDTFQVLRHGRGKTPLKPCSRTRPYEKIQKRLLITKIYVSDRNLTCKLGKTGEVEFEYEDMKNGRRISWDEDIVDQAAEKLLSEP